MKKIRLKKEVRIGIFATVMIMLLYWGINYIKGTNLVQGMNTYYATYDQVNGLQRSSPIVIKGYKVGVIQKMHFDPATSGKIILELRVKSKFHIPENSKARIFSDGLMGGKALEIELGNSPTYLQKGDTLRSEWDKDFLEVAGSEFEFIKIKANALVNEVMNTLQSVNAILDQNSASIATTMSNMARISGTLNEVITAESADLQSIVNNLNALSASLKNNAPKIDRIISNVEGFTDSLRTANIPQTMENLSKTLAELDTMLEKVNSGEGSVGKFLTDEALYDSLTMASGNLSNLLEDLKANPKRYVHFSIFGGGKKNK